MSVGCRLQAGTAGLVDNTSVSSIRKKIIVKVYLGCETKKIDVSVVKNYHRSKQTFDPSRPDWKLSPEGCCIRSNLQGRGANAVCRAGIGVSFTDTDDGKFCKMGAGFQSVEYKSRGELQRKLYFFPGPLDLIQFLFCF